MELRPVVARDDGDISDGEEFGERFCYVGFDSFFAFDENAIEVECNQCDHAN